MKAKNIIYIIESTVDEATVNQKANDIFLKVIKYFKTKLNSAGIENFFYTSTPPPFNFVAMLEVNIPNTNQKPRFDVIKSYFKTFKKLIPESKHIKDDSNPRLHILPVRHQFIWLDDPKPALIEIYIHPNELSKNDFIVYFRLGTEFRYMDISRLSNGFWKFTDLDKVYAELDNLADEFKRAINLVTRAARLASVE